MKETPGGALKSEREHALYVPTNCMAADEAQRQLLLKYVWLLIQYGDRMRVFSESGLDRPESAAMGHLSPIAAVLLVIT